VANRPAPGHPCGLDAGRKIDQIDDPSHVGAFNVDFVRQFLHRPDFYHFHDFAYTKPHHLLNYAGRFAKGENHFPPEAFVLQ